jgi:hypothetical protein
MSGSNSGLAMTLHDAKTGRNPNPPEKLRMQKNTTTSGENACPKFALPLDFLVSKQTKTGQPHGTQHGKKQTLL